MGKPRLFVQVGQRFGAGVVIDSEIRLPTTVDRKKSGGSNRGALLLCDCGNEYMRPIHDLVGKRGGTRGHSCGCMTPVLMSVGRAKAWKRQTRQRPYNFVDHTGLRYGCLVVSEFIEGSRRGLWRCRCDCGNEKIAEGRRLSQGATWHCGCQPKRLKRLPPGVAGRNKVLGYYRAGARDRGLCWRLSDEDFDRLTSQDCFYCGCAPSAVHGEASTPFIYNGIDRMDNDLGYIIENVVPCCRTCNQAKMAMPYGEFMAWIARLTEYHFFHPDVMPSRLLRDARTSA